MPLAVFLLRAYMSTLPKAVIESAKIDGASHYQTFWKLILPMSFPALASFAIFQFLWVWNDLLIALIFLGAGPNETVTINLQSLIGTFGTRWDLLAPGAFITMSLPLIVFFSLQRFFVRGMTAGSVKG
jgi:alpha-glucoside transport system permease protein